MARPKGVPNKIGAGLKADILEVWRRLGGRDHMARWAEKNQRDFYTKVLVKLVPTEVTQQIDVRREDELTRAELLEIVTAARLAQEAESTDTVQ